MVWLWRVYVCLCLPERQMPPGAPVVAPALPPLAICARRPLVVYALTVWFSRLSSMIWVISHLCRFQVLNQGAQKRFLDYYEKLCVSSRMLALRTARIVLFLSV